MTFGEGLKNPYSFNVISITEGAQYFFGFFGAVIAIIALLVAVTSIIINLFEVLGNLRGIRDLIESTHNELYANIFQILAVTLFLFSIGWLLSVIILNALEVVMMVGYSPDILAQSKSILIYFVISVWSWKVGEDIRKRVVPHRNIFLANDSFLSC